MKQIDLIRSIGESITIENAARERIKFHQGSKSEPSYYSGDFGCVPLILNRGSLWDDAYLNARNEAMCREIEWLESEIKEAK